MLIGIDIGLSNIHVVGLKNKKLVFKETKSRTDRFKLEEYLKKIKSIEEIFYSGNRKTFIENYNHHKIHLKDEIHSLGVGGLKLTGLRKAVVVSCGTGTCIVYAGRVATHLSGSSIGGGTISGLSELLLKCTSYSTLSGLASKGDYKNTDYVLSDISDSTIGFLNQGSSVSHFGKLKKFNKYDIAYGILNMVGQNIANMAYCSAKAARQKNIVLVGKVLDNLLIRKIIKDRIRTIDKKVNIIIPNNYEYATALGTIF